MEKIHHLSKNQLRQIARRRRSQISSDYRKLASLKLLDNLVISKLLLKYKRFGFYFPSKNEINILPCLNEALLRGKKCYLPQISAIKTVKKLAFAELNQHSKWYLNQYNIPEIYSTRYLKATQLDVLFLPLLGFDLNGFRLGMGGGYYDATLSYLKHKKIYKKPLRIGIAFDIQKFEEHLNFDDWDIPVDWVITESQIYKFNQ